MAVKAKGRWISIAGLLALSFLWSLGPLRSDLFPHSAQGPPPQFESEAVQFALLALVAGTFALARRVPWSRGREIRVCILVGLGLFAAPDILVYAADGIVSSLTRVALFSLTPVFAVVLEPYWGTDSRPPAKAGLTGALIAVLGTLCVFPLAVPASIGAGAAFAGLILAAALVAAANCAAVRMASHHSSEPIAPMAAIAGATAAVALALAGAFTPHATSDWADLAHADSLAWLWLALVPLPGLLLLFWLLRRMSAAAMTTRYLLAPLMAIVVEIALMRPAVSSLTWLGLLLIAAGAGWLALDPGERTQPDPLPLNLNRE
jgi:drug/metabolite transporter (DMT)-like permease